MVFCFENCMRTKQNKKIKSLLEIFTTTNWDVELETYRNKLEKIM